MKEIQMKAKETRQIQNKARVSLYAQKNPDPFNLEEHGRNPKTPKAQLHQKVGNLRTMVTW